MPQLFIFSSLTANILGMKYDIRKKVPTFKISITIPKFKKKSDPQTAKIGAAFQLPFVNAAFRLFASPRKRSCMTERESTKLCQVEDNRALKVLRFLVCFGFFIYFFSF